MPSAVTRSFCMQFFVYVVIACFLWNAVGCCENATETGPIGLFLHPTLNTCITDIIRAVCNALRPNPMKRNTELINSILGLPRVLQEAGR
ncbi:hypothetical protein JTE90_001079 [Oedothorax gibbosus]|uniref:Secreted protein n=1 Tax=Oedothorax gibbosus TaxID=931172 RepID=A0AAV6UIL7_9ARAC|nr:hypothetical protein JTE90_001079 [Oedothorax gibbosus]